MKVSPQALGALARAALETGEDPDARLRLDTALGPVLLAVHPEPDGAGLEIGPADCAGCVTVQGVLRAGLVASVPGGPTVRARGGAALDLAVEVRAETLGDGTDLALIPRYRGDRDVDVQLLGLPLGGMGLNEGLREGVRASLDGRRFPVAWLRAGGPLPLHDVWAEPGGVAHATLRVRSAAPAPTPPESVGGVWVGLHPETARGWLEAWLLRARTGRWSAVPVALRVAPEGVEAELVVWRHRRRPKARTYALSAGLRGADGRWALEGLEVRRTDRRGVDPVSGAIRRRVARAIDQSVGPDGIPGSGTWRVGQANLGWHVREIALGEDAIEVLIDLR